MTTTNNSLEIRIDKCNSLIIEQVSGETSYYVGIATDGMPHQVFVGVYATRREAVGETMHWAAQLTAKLESDTVLQWIMEGEKPIVNNSFRELLEDLEQNDATRAAWEIVIPDISKRIGKKQYEKFIQFTEEEMGNSSIESQSEALIAFLIESL